jgi:hypothetical protein
MRKPLADLVRGRRSTFVAKMAGSSPAMRGVELASLAVLTGAVLAAAACAGSDASWDLRNYHWYDGYAVLHGRLGVDLAPAQLQTFYAPVLDAASWLLLRALNGVPWLLNVVMAIPQAIAVCLSWAIARVFLSRPHALLATVISATGAATVSTLASTMSEAPMTALDLAALWLVLRRPERSLFAGMLAGAAIGLKLTATPYALGLLAAGGPKRLPRLALGVAAGAALCAGWWWFLLWRHYGNPVFPYFNDLFRSPWADPVRLNDVRFMPHGPLQAVTYPFSWAFHPSTVVSELPLRDPRLALALIAIPVILARFIKRAPQRTPSWPALTRPSAQRLRSSSAPPPDRSAVPLLAFFLTSLVLWEAQFSILRYLATLELVSGTLTVLAFRRLSWLAAPAIIAATIYPNWGRTAGPRAVAVTLPPIPANSRVVLLDSSPMAYVAAFASPSIRFIGADNNLTHPGQHTLLAENIAATIRSGSGPLWGSRIRPSPRASQTLRFAPMA